MAIPPSIPPSSAGAPNSPTPAPGGPDMPFVSPDGGQTMLGHPPGLFLLFLVEMWERFSYYGMRGLLVLYLTAAIAAHQLAPGVYTNTLRIQQSLEQSKDDKNAKAVHPAYVNRLSLNIGVGGSAAPAAQPVVSFIEPPILMEGEKLAGERAPAMEDAPLKFVKLRSVDDPAHPGRKKWEPTGEPLSSVSFVDSADRKNGEELRFRVVNPTDQKVKLQIQIERPFSEAVAAEKLAAALAALPTTATAVERAEAERDARRAQDPNYKVYFKVNDSTSVVSTTIGPDAKRDAEDEPFDIVIDYNRLDSGRSWIKADANTCYGWYTGMAYLLPIIGGLIADKLIGTHRSMIVGGILIALGHIVLGFSGIGSWNLDGTGMAIFVFGLALITIGTGHFKPSVSVMVGDLYPPGDPRRESAFSIFYMGINVGAFSCNLACGWLAENWGWHYGFAAAAVGMIVGLGIYLWGKPRYLSGIGETTSAHKNKAWVFLPVGVAAAALIGYLSYFGVLGLFDTLVSNPLVYYPIGIAALAYAAYFIFSQEASDRGPVATIFIYMMFNAVFWLAFEQAGSSLTTFTDELTSRRIDALDAKVPTSWFQSINPLLIILLAPIFGVLWAKLAKKNRNIAQPVKIGLGLIFVGLGYIVMVFAAMRLNLGVSKVSMIYICGCYFLHTVGEVILSPTGLSYVAKTAPKRALSSLMGIWFISSFVAGLMAGKLGALVEPIIAGDVTLPWNLGGQADFFLLFVVTSCGAGVLVIVLSPLLKRLQRSPND